MKVNVFLVLLSGILFVWLLLGSVAGQSVHEQVHITVGSFPGEMTVTWHTTKNASLRDPGQAQVQFATPEGTLSGVALAEVSHFPLDGFYTYRALLKGLKPKTKYDYKVGSPSSGWSQMFSFTTFQTDGAWLPKILVIGDLGWQNQEILPALEKEILSNGDIDILYHIGDLAYDLHDRAGEKGNEYMRSMEPLVSRVPYVTLPGNHEWWHNFTHYDARFSNVGDYPSPQPALPLSRRVNNFFHSHDIGPMHVISINTESYYFTEWGYEQITAQYNWLVEDLTKANAHRRERPWILVLGHRGIYCVRIGDSHCCDNQKGDRTYLRKGIEWKGDKKDIRFGLEKLFHDQGVDMQIYGHEHFYCRMYPMYDFQYHRGESAYRNPRAPIHITTGCAGSRELHPAFNLIPIVTEFSAFRDMDYGYGRIIFKERLRFVWEEYSNDKGKTIDSIEVSKSQDKPSWMH